MKERHLSLSVCAQGLVLLLFTGFLLSILASNTDRKYHEKIQQFQKFQQHLNLYGLPLKEAKQESLDLRTRSIESMSSRRVVDMLDGVNRSTVEEKELTNVISPGCLAYKPNGKGSLYPMAYADGKFHEVLFNHWKGTRTVFTPRADLLSFDTFHGLSVPTLVAEADGLETSQWVPLRTLYAYIPPAGFNFWLQYTSIFEPQFVNMLSMVDPSLQLKTQAQKVNSIIFNAVCSGPTDHASPLGDLSMGSTSGTGRQLQLVGLIATRALKPFVLIPRSCEEWQQRLGLATDGTVDTSALVSPRKKPEEYGPGEIAPKLAVEDNETYQKYRIAACFETLVIPRAYSLGHFYSNQKRVAFNSVHYFRSSFFKAYRMQPPKSVCEKLKQSLDSNSMPVLKVGIFGREDATHRILRNTWEIANWIEKGDISIEGVRLVPVRMRSMSGSLELLANTLREIDIFIAPHGAHWANGIFLPEHAVGIEINAGCWPKPNYNPWQEFYRGSASFSHVMDSLKLRNYEIYACSEAFHAKAPHHWSDMPRPMRFNCNFLRKSKVATCDFAATLDSLRAVFGMIEDKLRDADMSVFKSDVTARNAECRNGCCTHAQVDCQQRMGRMCPDVRLPVVAYRPTTDPKNIARLPANIMPRVKQD